MLPALIRKAVEDAGFDLILGEDAEWTRVGVSGVEGHAWVVPVGKGAFLALGPGVAASEFRTVTWTDVPLPPGAVLAARFRTPAELYDALRRVRVLLSQAPPLPEKRFEERLKAVSATEAEAVVRQRVGQDLFREMLMEYWDGRCAVSGIAVPELLRASHAKPWKDATDAERLDVYNGFLLAVQLDAIFDQGFLTFEDDGTARISPQLTGDVLRSLGFPDGIPPLRRIAAGHRPYLAYHRQHVFRRG